MPGHLLSVRSVVVEKLALFGLVIIIMLAVWFGIRLGESSKCKRKEMMSSFSDSACHDSKNDNLDTFVKIFTLAFNKIFRVYPSEGQKSETHRYSRQAPVVELIEDDQSVGHLNGKIVNI